MERNKIIEESKSIILDKSPEKINNPLTNKSPPKKSRNIVNMLALKESMSNIKAEKISIAPKNFTIDMIIENY